MGWEYALHEAKEPLLFVLKRQKRDGPEKVTVSTLFYVLDGSIYQAPTAHAIITSRMVRLLFTEEEEALIVQGDQHALQNLNRWHVGCMPAAHPAVSTE